MATIIGVQECQEYICIGSLSTNLCHCSAMKLSIRCSMKARKGKRGVFPRHRGPWPWTCVKGAMFSWCISCFLHLGLHVFLFSSIYTMIPLKEWSLCHEYLQQHDWFVLAALAGRLMDMAQILSFAAEDFLFPHPAVRLQPSGTERLSTNISLFKSVRSWGAAAQV